MDEGGCCWQSESDLMPAESAGMGATVRQRRRSCEHAHAGRTPLQGLVTHRWVKYRGLTHTYKLRRERERCAHALLCKVLYVTQVTFQAFVLEGWAGGTEIKGITDEGGRTSTEKTDGQKERGLMGLF